jgi:small ligand-binding sensory domain FIST
MALYEVVLRYPDREEVRQGVRVTTTRKRDAQCIAEALAQYGSTLAGQGHRWVVELSEPEGADFPDVLTALKECLEENAIAAVKVELDGKAYTMEGPD